MVLAGAMVPFGMPTLLICIGLLPTVVALVTDKDPQHHSAMTIGFMNVAGVVPFLIDLWTQGQTMEAAFAILRDLNSWLIMFGSAAIGHLLLYAIPPAMATMTLSRLETRLKILQDALVQLQEIWGPDVASKKTPDQLRR